MAGPVDVLPKPYSARSRVHEYGGGEFLVSGATIFFVNDKDQQVYALAAAAAPQRITRARGHPLRRLRPSMPHAPA